MVDKRVHCIGIGGIHVSAVAKLLNSRGVLVSGSDAVENEHVRELRALGIQVAIGHAASNIPEGTGTVVYSDAVPETNPERMEAAARGIEQCHSHQFLGNLFLDARQVVITGTHGKSTTTAMVGTLLIAAGEDPTVVVGTKVPSFSGGNLHIGGSNLLVVEGDEYRSHVLSYHPNVLVITNIEHDHPDVFPNLSAYTDLFRKVMDQIREQGVLIYERDDEHARELVESQRESLRAREIRVISVGQESGDVQFSQPHVQNGRWCSRMRQGDRDLQLAVRVPGEMNMRNAALAAAVSWNWTSEIDSTIISGSLGEFPGCWRRFEYVCDWNGVRIISDYAHHPTEVAETLKAAKAAFPQSRIILCFQPHQHSRTKGLFDAFLLAFDGADVLILAEIYDVPGREAAEDADVSSEQLLTEIAKRDTVKGITRELVYAKNLTVAERLVRERAKEGDLVLIMGAGDIDAVARQLCME